MQINSWLARDDVRLRDDERFVPADQLPEGLYERVRALVNAAEVREGHTVPWAAGRSKDGKRLYPDVGMPFVIASVQSRRTTGFHELAEWLMMNEGHTYDKDSEPPGDAHYIANGVEKIEVEAQGGNWEDYCLGFRPIIKETDDPALVNLPPKDDWDRRPYEDDDPPLEAEIVAADKSTFASPSSATSGLQGYDLEGADKKKVSKKKARYTAGPVDNEPCHDCTMFCAPDACTTVRGTISPDGHCKYFEAIAKIAKAKEPTAMDELKLFIPITKVDAAKRLVYGVATAELPDVSGEVCDYASTKPFYEKWSAQFEKATDGKSLGNLRSMHGSVAAGKLVQIAFNDDAKKIEICGKVVDDAEWQKVEEGVYTGFSQGGKYVKRWKDPADDKLTRYTAEPIEVSLVDNPCLPEATFSVIKTDGSTELRKFKAAPVAASETPNDNKIGKQVWINDRLPGKTFVKKADLQQALVDLDAEEAAKKAAAPVLDALADVTEKLGKTAAGETADADAARATNVDAKPNAGAVEKKDYSADERKKMADSGEAKADGSYPIKTAKDVANAVKDWARSNGSASDKRHIIKRAKAIGATEELPADWPGSTKKDEADKSAAGDLKKDASLYSVSNLLLLLDSVQYAEDAAESSSWGFGPSVELPKALTDRFGAVLVELGDIAAQMLDVVLASIEAEETSEAVATAARAGGLLKAALIKVGAKHSKADKELIQQAHDALADLDPDCCPADDDEGDDDQGDDDQGDDDAAKLAKQLDAERSAFGKLLNETILPAITKLAERIEKSIEKIGSDVKTIADQPLPMGVSSVTLRVVEKKEDGGGAQSTEKLQELADTAIAAARRGTTA